MEVFVYRIQGVSPLLQHNPKSMQSKGVESLTKKKVYVAEDEAEAGSYRNERGEFYIPTMAFRAAILSASKGRKIGKVAARSVLSGCVFPVEQEAILLVPKTGKPIKSYEIHTGRVVIQRNGVIRCRPLFREWACKLALEIDTEMLPNIDIVSQVLNIAGKIIGVMDWRPERLGIHGRFTATLETA